MKLTFERRRRLTGYIFVGPWILAAMALLFFPLVFSLVLSFSELENVTSYDMKFVGLTHYISAFRSDVSYVPMLLDLIRSMLINTPLILIFSLIMGIILSRKIACRGLFRSLFFLPVILGTGFVMEQLLGQNVDSQSMELVRGILLPEQVQLYIGPGLSGLIGDFLGLITNVMWKSGVQILMIVAGIQGISPSLYESARIDSATEWEMFWKITLPMLTPILLLNIVYTIVDSFTDSSNPMVERLLTTGFDRSEFEYAAAMGWVYFLIIGVFVAAVFLIMRRFIANVSDT